MRVTGCQQSMLCQKNKKIQGTTVPTSGRPPPIATTIPPRQEPHIHMMPTPGAPRSCAQQANEHPNTASHGVQSDPAIVAPSGAGSCGEKQTTSTGTQDTQGPGTSTATGHSATGAPKLRYDGAKWSQSTLMEKASCYMRHLSASVAEGKLTSLTFVI
ncbi:hypothetical protein AHAS_Ahas04G0197900 [Arachis hypogaea]